LKDTGYVSATYHKLKLVSIKDAADFINLFFAKFLNKNDEISEL
jgi:hypothetical protein